MRKITTGAAKRLIFSLCIMSVLGGCAVYPASPGYTYYDGYDAPAYVAPAPVYVGPPVYFGFSSWWGGGYHRGWHGGRHWHR